MTSLSTPPRRRRASRSLSPQHPATVPAHGRLLLVDDDESVRLTLGAVLEQEGYLVTIAATAAQAHEQIGQHSFDAIVADLRLENDESGVDVVAAARERDPDVVTIILTAYASMQAAVEALRGGVTNFLAKPCSISELKEAIERGLEKRHLLTQLRSAQREAQARQPMEVLAAVGRELASSLDYDEVLDRLARSIVPLFADWCVVHVTGTHHLPERVAVAHTDPGKEQLALELQRFHQTTFSESGLVREVLESAESRYVLELDAPVGPVKGESGAMASDLLKQLAPRSVISVPLAARGKTIGVFSFLQSDSGRQFTLDHVALAEEIGRRAALAIDNARQYEVRRLAEERQRFLADASKVLDASLDYQVTLDTLAGLAVPLLADWCTVHVVGDDGAVHSLALRHANPERARWARELSQRYPPERDAPNGVPHVLRTGQSDLYVDIPNDLLESAAVDEDHLRLLRAVGMTSAMLVPLNARGRTLGVISFVHAESGRHFGSDDLAFAEELASQAALAIDNARLYGAERRASQEAARLQRLSQQLGRSLAVEAVLDGVAAAASELLRCPVAGVFLLDSSDEGFHLVAGRGIDVTASSPMLLPRDRSIASRAIAIGESIIIADVQAEPTATLPILVSGGSVGSLVVAPIISGSGSLGVVEVYSTTPNAFSPHDAGLLTALTGAAAAALENARLFRAEQDARLRAERLARVSRQLGSSLAVEAVLNEVAAASSELLHSPVAGVFLLEESNQGFQFAAGRGIDVAASSTLRLPRERSIASRAILEGEAVIVPDAQAEPNATLPALVSGESVGSLIVAPIVSSSGPLGVIEVYSAATNAFAPEDAGLLAALAGAAAAALENARLYNQRERGLARLHTLLASLPVGVVVCDGPSGRVVSTNQEAERIWGSSCWSSMIVGERDPRAGRPVNGQPYRVDQWPLARALRQGETISGEKMEVLREGGKSIVVNVNATPIRDSAGKVIAAVSVYDDMSGEEELRRQKEQFLSAAAHDLKTPLTGIQGLVQLLQRQVRRLNIPEEDRLVANLVAVESSTKKMTGLVEELLDVSRLEAAGTLQLSRRDVDLIALARRVLHDQQPMTIRHELTIETSLDRLNGTWDETRLERVITNLVSNAIKYSPNGGKVAVRLSKEIDGGRSWAVLSVTDQGIGIPAADLDAVFTRFHRAANVPSRIPGSGIGLSYVHHVVVQHGGSINVRSTVRHGSTFTVRLPLEDG